MSEQSGRTEQSGQFAQPEQAGHPGKSDQAGHPGYPGHPGQPERPEQPAPAELSGSAGRRSRPGAAIASRIAAQVREFHLCYELPVANAPHVDLAPGQAELRQALIDEEVGELRAAALAGDVVGIADALADVVYIAYGTACVYGIDLDAVLDEVHASNMTKLGADGRPVRRADGKILKGPGYRSPDVAGVLSGRTATGMVPDGLGSGEIDGTTGSAARTRGR